MSSIQKIKKEYLLIGFLLVLLTVTVWIMITNNTKNIPPQKSIIIFTSPTPSTSILKNIIYPDLKSSVGLTKDEEIKKLPGLKSVNNLPDSKIEYSFNSKLNARDNVIITKNNVVVFERLIKIDENLEKYSLGYYKKLYGDPEREILGSNFYGITYTTYIYANKGLALIGDAPQYGNILEIQTFLPMSVDEYLKLWGKDVKPYTGEPLSP